MTSRLDHYESALLAELQQYVAHRDVVDPPPRRRRSRRRLTVVVAAAAAAAAAAVVVPGLTGLGAAPAYSVHEGNDGEIRVEVDRLEDADGLERELATWGVDADVTYVPDGGRCAPGRYSPAPGERGMSYTVGEDTFEVTLAPGSVHGDETLVIAASMVRVPPGSISENGIRDEGGVEVWLQADVVQGTVRPCVPVAASD